MPWPILGIAGGNGRAVKAAPRRRRTVSDKQRGVEQDGRLHVIGSGCRMPRIARILPAHSAIVEKTITAVEELDG
jgi:hypothetical protein